MAVTEYQILSAGTIELLVERVTAAIGTGWQPMGAPFIRKPHIDSIEQVCQAMTVSEAEEPVE